jgi:biopolymer transport protein ExbB
MSRRWMTALFAVGLMLVVVGTVFAGEGGGDVEVRKKSLLDLFQSTGIVGILLVILSVIGTALLLQYLVNYTEPKLNNPGLLSEVEQMLGEGDINSALEVAQSDRSYVGLVLTGALSRSFGGYEEVKHGFDEAAAVESYRLNANLIYLSLVGNIGPLLGLLGTVTGMISSFQVIETMKAPTPGDLAVGVYESLVNTTMGLFVAIIFLTAYFFLKNRVSDILLRINNQIGEVLSRTLAPEVKRS